MVSLARGYQEVGERGVRLASISVDPPSYNSVMVKKLDLPFPLLGDPRGGLLKRLGL
ncbi:MAG: redoxin domain-containing protein [Rubrobacter sp.]|nr:redoxin domain-containing protein [Rubrobacter sp.]